jgi:hypothetical protein
MLQNEYDDLGREVLTILETVRIGDVDPLDYQLVNAYRKLQELIIETEDKLRIDEMLNEVLGSKILRIQELARILTSPELYVEKLKLFRTKKLAKLATYRKPVILRHFNYDSLSRSFQKVTSLIDSLHKSIPEEQIPETSTLSPDFVFQSEDPLLIENLKRFVSTLPKRKSVRIEQILDCLEFEEFLRRFLYVILVIDKGMVEYDSQARELRRL